MASKKTLQDQLESVYKGLTEAYLANLDASKFETSTPEPEDAAKALNNWRLGVMGVSVANFVVHALAEAGSLGQFEAFEDFDSIVTQKLGIQALAERATMLPFEKGILKRALGGTTSQSRSGMAGVANSRACSWNRPPIDRMANLNLEVGTSTTDEMIGSIGRGVLMTSNCSWSIDDSRNKFQFGCEFARLIEDGALTTVVKNPNYRGISAVFWRNLRMVPTKRALASMPTPATIRSPANTGAYPDL